MSLCPSVTQLESLLDQQLTGPESEALSLHISGCGYCQEVLERLTEDPLASGCRPPRHSESAASITAVSDSPDDFLARLKAHPLKSAPHPAGRGAVNVLSEPPTIAGYEILGELGRGGMGVVYRARQRGLNRLVALKMILAGTHAGPKDLVRFRREAEAVARLRHPNIVQIYEIGAADGNPYIVLEFMEGGSLVQQTRGDPQPLLPAARLIETLARAIDFAHQQGIVHRDLKTANILLQRDEGRGTRDEGIALAPRPSPLVPHDAPIPKITDFGLAKRLDEPSSKTQSGEIIGTPSYMAPEQAAGKGDRVGPAADIYALGAILYELLTGRPPFKGATALDTVLQVIHEEPVRPRDLRPDLPRDLETICLKCLAKDPARRYTTAAALADDLHRFRRGRPILARPVRLHERVGNWAWRHPVPAALVAGMIQVALLGFAGVTWQWQEAKTARDAALAEKQEKEIQRQQAEQARAAAEAARRQEEGQRRHARAALYFSRISQSQLHWRLNDFIAAQQSLAKCVPSEGQEDWRGWEWYYLRGLLRADLFTGRHREGGPGGGAAYDGQGRWIASTVGAEPEGEATRPGEVRLWDARSGALVHTWEGPGTLHRLAIRPDGRRLALGTSDGQVLLWDTEAGREVLRRAEHLGAVAGLAFSPDGRRLASAGWDHTVRVWDGETGEVVHVLRGHEERVQGVAFDPRGRYLASASWDTTIRVWDARTGAAVRILSGHRSAVYCVVFSPDGRLLASAGRNGNLKIWEVESGRIIQSLTGHTGAVLSTAFSPDGRYLAYGGGDATVRVWDVESGMERVTFRGHTGPVESVGFSPDGQRLVSFSASQGAVKVWDLTRHPEHATFARTPTDVEAVALSTDRQRLLSVSVGGHLQTWDAATGVLLAERRLPLSDEVLSPAVSIAFADGGRRLAARCREDTRRVKVWDTATGAEVQALRGHTLPVRCVRFSPDGRSLVSCGCDPHRAEKPHEVKVWDVDTGAALATLTGTGLIFSVTFSPDRKLLAWGGQDGQVTVVDWKSGRKMMAPSKHTSDITGIVFSADGRWLATAGFEDRLVKLWRFKIPTGGGEPIWRPIRTMQGPSLVGDLAFSPDGQRLVGISRDVVKMWSVETGQEVLTLRGAAQRHWDAAVNPRVLFSPDGSRVVGTNWDESISVWKAEPRLENNRSRRRQAADERAHFWHLQETEHCLKHKNVAAARFHLQRLQGVVFQEPLQTRRDRLAKQLRNLP